MSRLRRRLAASCVITVGAPACMMTPGLENARNPELLDTVVYEPELSQIEVEREDPKRRAPSEIPPLPERPKPPPPPRTPKSELRPGAPGTWMKRADDGTCWA